MVALAFAVLRTMVAASGNVAGFIIVGAQNTNRAALPHGIPVYPVTGYDGEFYYRLALDPLAWGYRAFGIKLDAPYRISRIGYPALSWLAAGGRHALVPYALVGVNVVALALVAACATALARDAGRHAAWGLAVAGYWGFLWTLGRDTTEIVAAAALMAGLLAIRRERFVVAGAALAVGALARETVLVLVAAVVVARAVGWARALRGDGVRPLVAGPGELTRLGPGWADALWALPGLAFVGWQSAVWVRTGSFPAVSSGSSNSGAPFVGLVDGIRHYVHAFPSRAAVAWVVELAVLAVVILSAAWSWRSSRALFHERLAWIGYGGLSILLQGPIWLGDVGFRSLDEVFLLSGVLLLYSKRRMGWQTLLVAGTWCAVFIETVLYI
ncbi:MAG TPA: hypothetical protein VLZ77_14315 [Acidimicrobiales bacterium]|nr:hypothetical protein [Acidimicrobiales bacterium]